MAKTIRIVWILLNVFVGTLVVGSTVILIGCFDKYKRHIGKWPHMWGKWLFWSTGIKLHIKGLKNLDRNTRYVFAINHQSNLDILAVLAALPYSITILAKIQLFFVPFFGLALYFGGAIPVRRGNKALARKSVNTAIMGLKNSYRSLFIFPEGTRTKTGELGEFKRGGFHIPLEMQIPVVPVVIRGAREALAARTLKFNNSISIKLIINDPISTVGMTARDRFFLAKKCRDIIQTCL